MKKVLVKMFSGPRMAEDMEEHLNYLITQGHVPMKFIERPEGVLIVSLESLPLKEKLDELEELLKIEEGLGPELSDDAEEFLGNVYRKIGAEGMEKPLDLMLSGVSSAIKAEATKWSTEELSRIKKSITSYKDDHDKEHHQGETCTASVLNEAIIKEIDRFLNLSIS